MKVTFEGSENEIAKIVLAAFASSQPILQAEPKALETVEEIASPSIETPGVDIEPEPAEPIEHQQSIRSRVLGLIIRYPSMTIAEIASTLGLGFEQVRAPVRFLIARKCVDVAKGPDKVPFQPLRLIPTKTATRTYSKMSIGRASPRPIKRQTPRTRVIVSDYLRDNPGSTSTQVAKALGMAPNNISAALTTMNKIGTAKTEGAGGSSDPYRYTLAAA